METVSVSGVDDVLESFNAFIKKYPDKSGAFLLSQAKDLRKDVVKLVKNDTDTDGSSKRSLAKIKEYKISPIKGFGKAQSVDISGVAPHFHLVENGHQLVSHDGKNIGFVVGYHFFDRASRKRRDSMKTDLENFIDENLKSEGLL